MELTIIATSTFGLERIVADELEELGYDDLKIENGKVAFTGDWMDVVTCNLWLRTADRVLIQMTEFEATTFEELFQGTKSVDWTRIIPTDGFMHVVGKSVKSTLYSVPDCQSIVKKAIIEQMKTKFKTDLFPENGPEYKIEVSILKDVVTLTIDTTGAGLHKRGYRDIAGEAPLKETLAAALIHISRWNTNRILADPFCGSGTIPIEAAMIGRNIAPGLNRTFVSEKWDAIPKKLWEDARKHARSSINNSEFKIYASDIDSKVLNVAIANAKKANVSDNIVFERKDAVDFNNSQSGGIIITNPPYGERLSEAGEVSKLYKKIGHTFSKLDNWSLFILTSFEEFERNFGKKANKNRKLYNGRLQCYLYQYFEKLVRKIQP